ncbi:hypothetical protein ALP43_02492 [Pseudomonas azotoformans]|uniref:hypothetical protein n=1 Tax=Pseudomonas syringae TaxID=317 RepID=UPI000F3BFE25|nr:hypothetical protein [Pseudomonas azotoformans]RMT70392.1 hypothetical protein ALP43_02492 [Pseudomonas azotoformans]
MAHAIRSKQVRSPVTERIQSKPRLVSVPKSVSITPTAQPFDGRAGFTYYEVQVVYEDAGLKQTYPGVLDECLALELKAMLEPEVAPYPVRISWVAGWAKGFENFLRMNDRVTDMIQSVRSAERPGHEFLARLGQFGPYEGYAPQNSQAESVAPNLSEVRP